VGYRVFICYRRDDGEFARNIERELARCFGADNVFLDTDQIRGGEQWKRRVLEVLESKPVVVTLITTRWNSRRGGKPKLLDGADHIRFELETALGQGLDVVPVLHERAHWPKSSDSSSGSCSAHTRWARSPYISSLRSTNSTSEHSRSGRPTAQRERGRSASSPSPSFGRVGG
jgi:hypothetical protein